MTDEQIAALLQMEDLGGMEKQMQQQNALATQLRGQALQPSAGKDWGSQLARGLQGGMAGYAMKQQPEMMKQYGDAKTRNTGTAIDILLKRKAMGAGPEQLSGPGMMEPPVM